MINFSLKLFDIYKYDSDCWGVNLLTFGIVERSLFGFNADEDGWYLSLIWTQEWKVKNIN